jgi:hypothetical protein
MFCSSGAVDVSLSICHCATGNAPNQSCIADDGASGRLSASGSKVRVRVFRKRTLAPAALIIPICIERTAASAELQEFAMFLRTPAFWFAADVHFD